MLILRVSEPELDTKSEDKDPTPRKVVDEVCTKTRMQWKQLEFGMLLGQTGFQSNHYLCDNT